MGGVSACAGLPASIDVVAPVFTPERVAAYGTLTADTNPIHTDAAFAAGTRFGRPIVHGLCVLLPVWDALEAALGIAAMTGMTSNLRFSAPVFVGTSPTYRLRRIEAGGDVAAYALSVLDETGREAVSGEVRLTAANVESPSGKDRTAENFPVGVLVAPRLRPHVHAFYAFARNADDIADSPGFAEGEKLARLGVMEDVLLGRREAGSPSAMALRASLAETGVTPDHACDLLRAFRQDASNARTPSWAALMEYCRYSAMPVGRYVLDLHGAPQACHGPSDALCSVLQVLNHLQDCARDLAELDRCYLPLDMLAAAGANVEDLRRPRETPALRAVFSTLLDRCDELNGAARHLPARTNGLRLRLECAVIVGLARRLTARLRAGDPLASRVKLSRMDVARSVLGALA